MLTKGQVNEKVRAVIRRRIMTGEWTEASVDRLAKEIAKKFDEYGVSATRVKKLGRKVVISIRKQRGEISTHISAAEQRKLHKDQCIVTAVLADQNAACRDIGTGYRPLIVVNAGPVMVSVINPTNAQKYDVPRECFFEEDLKKLTPVNE